MVLAPFAIATSVQVGQLLPVDEATSRPDFFSFRAGLQTAVARRDVPAILGAISPGIRLSFGADGGVEAFHRIWKPEDPTSRLWDELGQVLALGGSFETPDTFVAPYVFSRWPSEIHAFEHVAVTAADVRIRLEPRPDAAVLTARSFSILPLAPRGPAPVPQGWTAVRVDRNTLGYVSSDLVRSPIDYRAIFGIETGRWRLMAFLAGD
jgi:hypothetical protein